MSMDMIEVTSTSITTVQTEKDITQKIQSWGMLVSCRCQGNTLTRGLVKHTHILTYWTFKYSYAHEFNVTYCGAVWYLGIYLPKRWCCESDIISSLTEVSYGSMMCKL